MSTEQNKAIVRRMYEILTTGNLDALDEVIAANLADHNPAPGLASGLDGTKQWFAMLRSAFPDFRLTIADMIAEGDKVVARVTVQSTHRGEFMGIPPTGTQVTITGIDIVRIARGQIVERWGEFDNMGMMQQLGVIPSQG